jgi:hypothetical protein
MRRNAIATKKFPWISLSLLLSTYGIIGWQLAALESHWILWIFAAIATILLAVAVASPWSRVRDGFASCFASDTKAFSIAVVIAFFSVVIITWLHIFSHILVVFAASTLVRLDVQAVRWSSRQSFWLIAIASLASLALGAFVHTRVEPYLTVISDQ